MLSAALLRWIGNANITNEAVRGWVDHEIPTRKMHERLKNATSQIETWDVIDAILHGTDLKRARLSQVKVARDAARILSVKDGMEPWQSVRHLLGLYGPELLQVLDSAIATREKLLEELRAQRLRKMSGQELAGTLKSLESTSQKLDLASTMLSQYIREKFPLEA
jgi:hypothetical protein